jgi:hypothetical protein
MGPPGRPTRSDQNLSQTFPASAVAGRQTSTSATAATAIRIPADDSYM